LSLLQTKTYPAFKRSAKKSKNHCLEEFENPTGNFHDVDYLGYTMPAFKEQIHEWCGEWKSKGCLNIERHKNKMAYLRRYQRSCYRADCNVCAKKWLARLANRSTARITIYQAYNPNKRAKHIVVSPPSWQHHKSLKFLRKQAYKYLKKVGCYGGTMIFHAYRSYVDEWNKKMWYFAPHFHIIGFGWIVGSNVAKTYHKDGWLVKNIGVRKSVFQTIYYQLSHCTIVEGKHTLIWFGELGYHNSILKVEDEPILDQCPECFAKLEELVWNGRGEPPPNEMFDGFVNADSYFAPKIPYITKI